MLHFWHYLGNRFLTLLWNAFTNLNLTDMGTCCEFFRRKIIQSIQVEESRFGFEPAITAKVAKLGCRVYEVGISYSGRTDREVRSSGGVTRCRHLLKYKLRSFNRTLVAPAGNAG